MSLDLNRVCAQLTEIVERLNANLIDEQLRLTDALRILHEQSGNIDILKEKIDSSKTTWLVAGIKTGLDSRYPAPVPPSDYAVIATDGSHIEVDRHQPVRCFVLNISHVLLRYGRNPDAFLENYPRLYASEDELVIRPPDGQGREQLIEGALLGLQRSVAECRHLADIAASVSPDAPALAILDGTLILWGLEPFPDFVTDILLEEGLLREFNRIRSAANQKRLSFASFISGPRSNDVKNTLRIAVCPFAQVNCDRNCSNGKRGCAGLESLDDRKLFGALLSSGERSDIFVSRSQIVRERYREHEIHFFYLKVDDAEISRIEIPGWIAADERLVDLTHSLALDQCRKGNGYPVALAEAHEQAVITQADRQNFWHLVETSLIERKIPTRTTGKNWSKRTRWL